MHVDQDLIDGLGRAGIWTQSNVGVIDPRKSRAAGAGKGEGDGLLSPVL